MSVLTRSELEDLLSYEALQRAALAQRVEVLEHGLRDRSGTGYVEAWVGEVYRAADHQLTSRRLLCGAEMAAEWLASVRGRHAANECDVPTYVARQLSLVAVRANDECLWGDPAVLSEG